MSNNFTPLQLEVFRHYEDGEFYHLADEPDALDSVGDGLFRFAVLEAGEADTPDELRAMLWRAVDQLTFLAERIE